MNERIKELMDEVIGFRLDPDSKHYEAQVSPEDLEMFAELIIGHAIECVRDVLRNENSDLNYTAASQVQNRIKECFGVEE
jgi:hypothetical protein